jgi:hypothetical protein
MFVSSAAAICNLGLATVARLRKHNGIAVLNGFAVLDGL